MTDLTLLLFVDAFRPDYLRDAPFLRGLARRGASGRLREPFGFLPHPAYFAGLSPEEYGYSNLWCCDPSRSPFSGARWLPAGAFRAHTTAGRVRHHVDEQARARVSGYAASYVSSMAIPPELLPYFAVAEPDAPWSSHAGYRSLFHELDARGDAWFASAWPLTNNLPDHSDAGIVEHALASLEPRHRFAHIHLQELDAAGHWFGPEGNRLRALVRQTDGLIETFIGTLRERYDTLKIIVFGDHGMVSVTRAVDVRPALTSTGLVPGVDYVYFLDSTMVRLWFLTQRSRSPLINALSNVAGLRLVTAEDKVHHRIAGCDPSNAHEIFLADPGVVVSPDFFSGPSAPLGMHGYDPDCADNQGIFIAVAPELPPSDAGIVDARDIYHWSRECLELADPRPGRVTAHGEFAPFFTQSPLPGADASVARQLDTILARLAPLTSQADAIVLTGSFGRGEGGAVDVDSDVRAVNDFDLFVIGGPDISKDLTAMAPALAGQVGLDFLDLVWTDGAWPGWSPTMLNVDLRYGSQVLCGSSTVLERMPAIAAGDIPMQDALTLLLNRIGGLLSGLGAHVFGQGTLSTRERRYLINQIVKALVAVGDSHLIQWRAYDPSYRVRRERFASLAPGAGVDESIREVVDYGYRLKVVPNDDEVPDLLAAAVTVAPLVLETLRHVAAATYAKPFATLLQVCVAIRDLTGEWVDHDNDRLVQRPEVARLVGIVTKPQSVRQRILAALPLLLNAITLPDFDPSAESSSWESDRAATVSAWLAMNHG